MSVYMFGVALSFRLEGRPKRLPWEGLNFGQLVYYL